jgi:hypothetical protein
MSNFKQFRCANIAKGERNGKKNKVFLTSHCRAASYIRENKDSENPEGGKISTR